MCHDIFYRKRQKSQCRNEIIRCLSSGHFSKPISIFLKETVVGQGSSKIMLQITAKAYVIDGRYESAFISDVHVRIRNSFFERKITQDNTEQNIR